MRKFIVMILLIPPFLSTSCIKDKINNGNVIAYSNIIIGNQDNTKDGHFFKPRTGEVISIENTTNQEQFLALMFFTESKGLNSFLTFPANGEGSSTFGTVGIRQFDQIPCGINYSKQEKLVSGMIKKTTVEARHYDSLALKMNWEDFNHFFTQNNNGRENLQYQSKYQINPEAGEVYLIQFNKLVRAIICVREINKLSENRQNIKFDILVESHDEYRNLANAKYIQPNQKLLSTQKAVSGI